MSLRQKKTQCNLEYDKDCSQRMMDYLKCACLKEKELKIKHRERGQGCRTDPLVAREVLSLIPDTIRNETKRTGKRRAYKPKAAEKNKDMSSDDLLKNRAGT